MTLKVRCYDCGEIKQCAQVPDVGWVCIDRCRGNHPPPAHIMEKIAKEVAAESALYTKARK